MQYEIKYEYVNMKLYNLHIIMNTYIFIHAHTIMNTYIWIHICTYNLYKFINYLQNYIYILNNLTHTHT